MQQRLSMLSGITINIPNAVQNGQPFNVNMITVQVIADAAGQQIGHPIQQQQPVIESDLTPEVLAALNAQLAYLGHAITPIAPKATNA